MGKIIQITILFNLQGHYTLLLIETGNRNYIYLTLGEPSRPEQMRFNGRGAPYGESQGRTSQLPRQPNCIRYVLMLNEIWLLLTNL